MTALQYLNSLRPALPIVPPTKPDIGKASDPGRPMSNGELRRLIEQRGVLINTEPVTINEEIDFPVFSVVFYPKSPNKRCTLV